MLQVRGQFLSSDLAGPTGNRASCGKSAVMLGLGYTQILPYVFLALMARSVRNDAIQRSRPEYILSDLRLNLGSVVPKPDEAGLDTRGSDRHSY